MALVKLLVVLDIQASQNQPGQTAPHLQHCIKQLILTYQSTASWLNNPQTVTAQSFPLTYQMKKKKNAYAQHNMNQTYRLRLCVLKNRFRKPDKNLNISTDYYI